MTDEIKGFLEVYRKLNPVGRADVLSRAQFALDIQEATKERMIANLLGSCPEVPARREMPATGLKEVVNA